MKRLAEVRAKTGADGVLIDSFLTFAMLPNMGIAQPVSELPSAVKLLGELRKTVGFSEIHVEGVGPFGVSSSGFGGEALEMPDENGSHTMIGELVGTVVGREYGLYRWAGDLPINSDSYYRALASKGPSWVRNMKVLDQLAESVRSRIARANLDYVAVLEHMSFPDPVRDILLSGAGPVEVEKVALDAGAYVPFRRYAAYLMSRNLLSPTEALATVV
jgi:hypothetical protein